MHIHTVKEDEGVYEVAAEYGVSPIKLIENNGIAHRGRLIPGEELLILIPTRQTNARRGDNISDIARRFCAREDDLIALNPELMGRPVLYEGQPIAVRYGEPEWGLGIGNGYLYRGCSRERLVSALPYLSYLTVSAGVARGERVALLFDEGEVCELARAAGKRLLFRVWLGEAGDAPLSKIVSSAALIAKAKGYSGLTLGGMSQRAGGREEMLEARRAAMECDLLLFCEADAAQAQDYTDYADGSVLTYDKIQNEKIPSFDDGEREVFTRFAEVHDSLRAFIDLSPFALVGGKYVTKGEARDAILRSGGRISKSECGGYARGSAGRGRRERTYIFETLGNTERKLRLLSELGYYGISFDVARTPIYELLMFRTMFSSAMSVY